MARGQPASSDLERMPPQSVEIEKALLSSMLLDNRAIAAATDMLRSEDFYHGPHGKIFDAIVAIFEMDGEVDMLVLGEYLKQQRQLDEVGGLVYLADVAQESTTWYTADQHARLVKNYALARTLIMQGRDLADQAHSVNGDVTALADKAVSDLLAVAVGKEQRRFQAMEQVIDTVNERLEEAGKQERSVAGLYTGFWSLNQYLNGLCPSEFTIIAARPSIGKSTLARQIAVNVAQEEKKAVGLFSLEMSALQQGQCLVCALSGIPLPRFRRGDLRDEEWQRYTATAGRVAHLPIYIEDRPGLSITQARAAMLRLSAEVDVAVWIFDYLQLMDGKGSGMNEQAASISKGLKELAREYDVPVIALSQLNREVEHRPGKEPQISDLRDSGGLEQDADNVVLIHRPGHYESIVRNWQGDKEALKQHAKLLFPKTRFGPTGSVPVQWDCERALFANPGEGEQMDLREDDDVLPL